jgi:hypothetical protein
MCRHVRQYLWFYLSGHEACRVNTKITQHGKCIEPEYFLTALGRSIVKVTTMPTEQCMLFSGICVTVKQRNV